MKKVLSLILLFIFFNTANSKIYDKLKLRDSINTKVNRKQTKTIFNTLANTKLSVVNIKSFGALGNGIADDWAAILSASNYAEQNNLILYFPSGTYNTSGSFTEAYSRTNTTSYSVLFGENVKIKVIDTINFVTPTNRILFGYYTGTVPHTFKMIGGNVEIDGNNLINSAISTSQNTNTNIAFTINCKTLKIKNLYSNSYTNRGTHAIYSYGTYPLMEIKNIIIDSVNRSQSTNLTTSSQAILVANQLGKTIIDNVVVKNIGNVLLTQDCDGIVVRGIVSANFDFVGGDFTIKNSYILNSRGRAIKAQSSNVKVFNTRIEQSDLLTFNSVNSIDFQFGNGIVDGCTFVYGSGTLGSSFASIAFQERVRFIDLASRATNNTVLSKSQMVNFAVVLSSATTAASADILIYNNTIIPFDTAITNVLTRGLIEFSANQLLAMPPSSKWSFTIKNNTTYTEAYLLTYTGYTSGDLSNKLKLDITGNKNYGTGLQVFNQISGNRITSVRKYRFKNNSGWNNLLPEWDVNFTRGSLKENPRKLKR